MKALARASDRSTALAHLCVSMVGLGIITASVGPLLPELAAKLGLPLSQAGVIISLLFLGAAVAALAAGPFGDRMGRRVVILAAMILYPLATVALSLCRSFPLAVACGLLAGFGGGAFVVNANALLAVAFAERNVSALNIANMFFGIGAFCGPALVGVSLQKLHVGVPALWLGALIMLSQAPLLWVSALARAERPERAAADAPPSASPGASAPGSARGRSLLLSALLWTFAAALFFATAIEQTLGGWIAVYMNQAAALSVAEGALVASGFWISYTVGRFFVAGLGLAWPPKVVLPASALVLLAGMVLVNISAGRSTPTIVGFVLAGLGLGPVAPTFYAVIGRAFRSQAGTALGLAVGVGLLGAVIFPWLEGRLMQARGSGAAVRVVLLIAAVVAVLAYVLRSRGEERT
jgi:fucose permease